MWILFILRSSWPSALLIKYGNILCHQFLKKILCSCSNFAISFTRIKQKSPKRQLRALKKSYHQQPEAPPQYLFSNTSSGCLQDRRPTYFTFTSNSMRLVSFNFFCLPILLERTALLQWSLPAGSTAKEALSAAVANRSFCSSRQQGQIRSTSLRHLDNLLLKHWHTEYP